MRISEKPLEPWIIIDKSGTVQSAHCTCMAGLSEGCSHVAAVLFAMENGTRILHETSVTDVPAYWLFPAPAKLASPFQRIGVMDFRSASKKRKLLYSTPTRGTPPSCERGGVDIVPPPTEDERNNFFTGLHRACPNAVALSLNRQYSDTFVPKSLCDRAPKHLGQLYDPDLHYDNFADILTHCAAVDISVTTAQVEYVLNDTEAQSKSKLWFAMRVGRVTASNFYAVCHTRLERPALSILRSICTSDRSFTSAATNWGKEHESTAREQYTFSQTLVHDNFTCSENGLFLSTDYPMFGATPDGVVSCECCGNGILEIKCPFTLQSKSMNDLEWLVIDDDGEFRLKRSHKYFYQVQMQLFVSKRLYCDFVVWSPEMMCVERIMPDTVWWDEKSRQGMRFHAECVMPELCTRFFTKQSAMPSVSESFNIQAASPSCLPASDGGNIGYCVCKGPDDGRKMICCDNNVCTVQWYHVRCLKLKNVPKGKWYCPLCRGKSAKVCK